jgi:hypothetical protein
MPHLAHRRVPLAVSSPLASRSPSPSPSHSSPTPSLAIPQPGPRDLQSSKRAAIRNPKTWPPFPPPQSLTDETAQLHLTLRNPLSSHSHSPSPSPHLSRQPSGRATPESTDSSLLPILAVESFDPGNPHHLPSRPLQRRKLGRRKAIAYPPRRSRRCSLRITKIRESAGIVSARGSLSSMNRLCWNCVRPTVAVHISATRRIDKNSLLDPRYVRYTPLL